MVPFSKRDLDKTLTFSLMCGLLLGDEFKPKSLPEISALGFACLQKFLQSCLTL